MGYRRSPDRQDSRSVLRPPDCFETRPPTLVVVAHSSTPRVPAAVSTSVRQTTARPLVFQIRDPEERCPHTIDANCVNLLWKSAFSLSNLTKILCPRYSVPPFCLARLWPLSSGLVFQESRIVARLTATTSAIRLSKSSRRPIFSRRRALLELGDWGS